jgi:hypothetical protein
MPSKGNTRAAHSIAVPSVRASGSIGRRPIPHGWHMPLTIERLIAIE